MNTLRSQLQAIGFTASIPREPDITITSDREGYAFQANNWQAKQWMEVNTEAAGGKYLTRLALEANKISNAAHAQGLTVVLNGRNYHPD